MMMMMMMMMMLEPLYLNRHTDGQPCRALADTGYHFPGEAWHPFGHHRPTLSSVVTNPSPAEACARREGWHEREGATVSPGWRLGLLH